MKRRPWRLGLSIGVAILLAGGIYVRLLAGGPVRFVPGGWLRGEVVPGPIGDWSFAREYHSVDVESRARLLPYSRGCWFMVHDDTFFLLLPSLFGDGLKLRLDEDPHVRLRLAGRIYEQIAVPHSGDDELAVLLSPFLRRQMAVEIEGPVRRVSGGLRPELWVYRMENP